MLTPDIFVGIDPGKSGAIAILRMDDPNAPVTVPLKLIEQEIAQRVSPVFGLENTRIQAVIEHVHASPQMGTVSAFTFGRSFGFCLGLLAAHQIRYEVVRPLRWQTALRCQTKGNKDITKIRALELYPTLRVTHTIADALLLAEYARQMWHGKGDR